MFQVQIPDLRTPCGFHGGCRICVGVEVGGRMLSLGSLPFPLTGQDPARIKNQHCSEMHVRQNPVQERLL